jgi:hypothetical protein
MSVALIHSTNGNSAFSVMSYGSLEKQTVGSFENFGIIRVAWHQNNLQIRTITLLL